jgi:thiamine biosynthesis protein ThiI
MAENTSWIIIARPGGEIGIKSSGTRRRIIRILQKNIQRRLSTYSGTRIRHFRNYLLIEGQFNKKTAYQIAHLLSKYEPGITSTNPAVSSSSIEDDVITTSLEFFPSFLEKDSDFAVRVKREGKHDYSSIELAAKIGKAILNQNPSLSLKVNLTAPQHELNVDVKQELAFYYYEKIPGLSGYPPGMQGSIIGLLRPCSFDFMASFLMLRRGVQLYPVFLKTDNCLTPSSVINEKFVRKYCLKTKSLSIDLNPILKKNSELTKCAVCVIIRSLVGETARQQLGADGIVDGISFSEIDHRLISIIDQHLKVRKLYPLLLNLQKYISFPFTIPDIKSTPQLPISEQTVLFILQNEKKMDEWREYISENLHEIVGRQ